MRVKMYTTRVCPYCYRAKSLLKQKGIPYDEIDVSLDSQTRNWLVEMTGQKTVPQIFIDGKPIGGSDDLHALHQSGELDRIMAAVPGA
jgi:glutaredoxin 3